MSSILDSFLKKNDKEIMDTVDTLSIINKGTKELYETTVKMLKTLKPEELAAFRKAEVDALLCGADLIGNGSFSGIGSKSTMTMMTAAAATVKDAMEREKEKPQEEKKEKPVQNDPVSHPAHYTYGKIEVIDFLDDQDLPFALANVIKYVCRAGRKTADPSEDLAKASWYLDHYRKNFDKEKA